MLSVDLNQHLGLPGGLFSIEGKPLVNELQQLCTLSHAGVVGFQPLHDVELCVCVCVCDECVSVCACVHVGIVLST